MYFLLLLRTDPLVCHSLPRELECILVLLRPHCFDSTERSEDRASYKLLQITAP